MLQFSLEMVLLNQRYTYNYRGGYISNLISKSNFEDLFPESTAAINYCISQGPKREEVALSIIWRGLMYKETIYKVKV